MKKSRKKTNHPRLRRAFKWTAYVLLALFAFSLFQVCLLKYVPVYYTPLMLRRSWEAAGDGRTLELRRQWVPLEDISPNLVQAVVATEDNYFRGHYGFSLSGMKDAYKKNQDGKIHRGGSTISQQCAKNVFTFGYRHYFRKAVEAYYTVLIEIVWGKERIMEVYLNVIEMGDGVFGAEACAQTFFKIPAKQLTKRQSALIAACIPNPRKLRIDAPSMYVIGRQKSIISKHMPNVGEQKFDKKSLQEARQRYKNRPRGTKK